MSLFKNVNYFKKETSKMLEDELEKENKDLNTRNSKLLSENEKLKQDLQNMKVIFGDFS